MGPVGRIKAVQYFKKNIDGCISICANLAKDYVDAIDSDPTAKELFVHAMPEVSPTAWELIESVGRGKSSPDIFFGVILKPARKTS